MKPFNRLLYCSLIFVVLASLFSCSANKKQPIVTVPVFASSPLDSVYNTLRPDIQQFVLNNDKAISIKAARGTQVFIPAGAFVNSDGEKVTNVQLELVEAFSLTDFMTAGLTTLSDSQLLESNGMIYVNARSGHENLRLAPGATLTVSMPSMTGNTNGFQLFRGDGKSWKVDSAMTEVDYIMPLPLDLLYPKGNKTFWRCIHDAGGPDEQTDYYDTTVLDVANKKYENTVIATEAFRDRISGLFSIMWHMSLLTDKDRMPGEYLCDAHIRNYTILKVYFDHPSRSLKESDSIAKKVYRDYFRENKEELAAYCEEVNAYYREHSFPGNDTFYYFDLRKQSLEQFFMSALEVIPSTETRELVFNNDHGVNLTASDAYEQLLAKGVSEQEANRIMSYHFRQTTRVKELRDQKKAVLAKEKLNVIQETVFAVAELGWINCDRFYDDPAAGKAAIYVSGSGTDATGYTEYSLIIPSMNVRLTAYPNGPGQWTFTKKEGMYTKLPLGTDAIIVGVGLQTDTVYFARQKITISDSMHIHLPVKMINKAALKDSLQMALKK